MTDTPLVTGPFGNQVNFSYFLFLVFGFGLSRESSARASTMDRLAIIRSNLGIGLDIILT